MALTFLPHFAIHLHLTHNRMLSFPCIFVRNVYVNLSACWEGRSTVWTFACLSVHTVLFCSIFPNQSWMLHICQKHTSRITLHKLLLQVCIDIFVFVTTFVNDALDIACIHISWKRTVCSVHESVVILVSINVIFIPSIEIDEAHLHPMFCNFSSQSMKKDRKK